MWKTFACTLLLGAFTFGCSSSGDGSTAGVTPNTATVGQKGETLAKRYACASCHGATDGTLSGGAAPATGTTGLFAPNITPDEGTGIGGWTDAQIIDAVRTGKDDEGQTLCSVMPRFSLTDDEAKQLVAYLRALPPVKKESKGGDCPGR